MRDFLLNMFPRYSVGCEIGVHKGHFSRRILYIVEPQRLHLIDPWKFEVESVYDKSLYGCKRGVSQEHLNHRCNNVKKWFSDEILCGQVIVHRGYSHQMWKHFEDEYFDWVYIDGNHLYEFVKMDLEFFYKKVKIGGLIAGDDYETKDWWDNGVKRAVDEFISQYSVEVLLVKHNQYVLKRVSS